MASLVRFMRHLHGLLFYLWIMTTFLPSIKSQQFQPAPAPDCQTNRENCICLPQSIINDISQIFSTSESSDPSQIESRVQEYECQWYDPLPPYLLVQVRGQTLERRWKRQRRFRRYHLKRYAVDEHERFRRRRQMNNFPNDERPQLVDSSIPMKPNYHRVPFGSKVTLSCFENAHVQQDLPRGIQYQWAHQSGMPISFRDVTFDPRTGQFTFSSVKLDDTDIYNCTMMTPDANGQVVETKTFQSQIDVEAAISLWLSFSIAYTTEDGCRNTDIISIRENLKNWIPHYVCNFCQVANISVTCVDFEGYEGLQLQLALSAMDLERLLVNSQVCPVDCMEKVHLKVLTILSMSLVKLFSLQIRVQTPGLSDAVYTSLPDTIFDEITRSCPPGYYSIDDLCAPCGIGSHSSQDNSACYPCEVGHYQQSPGKSACDPCPTGYSTAKMGCVSQMDCVPVLEMSPIFRDGDGADGLGLYKKVDRVKGQAEEHWGTFRNKWLPMIITGIVIFVILLVLAILLPILFGVVGVGVCCCKSCYKVLNCILCCCCCCPKKKEKDKKRKKKRKKQKRKDTDESTE